MKKIFLSVIAVVAAFSFTSCSESDLDSSNYTEANTANYPATPSDLNKEVAALYGVMNQYANDPLQTPWLVNSIMSDDCFGAGGTGDVECHAIGHLMSNKEALFETAWKSTYVGIARANSIIDAASKISFTDQSERNQLLGEAYFMRGLFYLWGSQFWGDIPAYWSASSTGCKRESAEEVIYPHILADFYSASELMRHGATTQGDGHATKGAADGFLARAYMFYQGFYKKAGELATANLAAVELPAQEGCKNGESAISLTKDMVVTKLKDCIDNGGYSLVSDYRLLWQYTNQYSAKTYSYVSDLAANGQYWAGNGNSEEMFQVQYGNMASWSGTISMGFTNMTSLYCGLRCDDNGAGVSNGTAKSVPFGQGWGQGTINPNLWSDWSDVDMRKKATILNAPDELGLNSGFVYTTSCTEDAGFYNKKLVPNTCSLSTFDSNTDAYTWWGVYRKQNTSAANNNGNSFQGDHFGDTYLMRYADVLLMMTELTGDAQYMNQVRKRARLSDKAYSWAQIKEERRFEFAGEGLRFNDLRRWSGKDGGESCEAATALERQNGVTVYYTGKKATMKHASSSWKQRYAETDGFLQIPPKQIEIVNDESVLKQNKGWGTDCTDWSMSGTPVYN